MFRKIYIEITNICNLKCKFCPETNRNKEYMSVENFEKIIKEIQNHTKLVCLHVKGEPLLHPHLDEILNILDKYNLQVNITTNGTLIKRNLETIKKHECVRQINFSLHSVLENGGFNEKYLSEIFECANKLENVIISYRLWNLQNIQENSLNIDIINNIQSFYNIENLQLKLSQNSFYEIRKNMYINQDTEFTWPNVNGKKIIENGRCLALKEQVAILVDGTVVPCCLDNDGVMKLGNIFTKSLDDILQNSITVTIKNNFENGIITCDICKTCGFLKRLEKKRSGKMMSVECEKEWLGNSLKNNEYDL